MFLNWPEPKIFFSYTYYVLSAYSCLSNDEVENASDALDRSVLQPLASSLNPIGKSAKHNAAHASPLPRGLHSSTWNRIDLVCVIQQRPLILAFPHSPTVLMRLLWQRHIAGTTKGEATHTKTESIPPSNPLPGKKNDTAVFQESHILYRTTCNARFCIATCVGDV